MAVTRHTHRRLMPHHRPSEETKREANEDATRTWGNHNKMESFDLDAYANF